MTSLNTSAHHSHRPGIRCLAAALVLSVVAVGIVPAEAEGAKSRSSKAKKEKDPREMQAREAFAAGSYQEALDIYTKLYAVKLHPTFLRNIARCYQNLGEPERAISSFREYLRKAKDMTSEERTEVEGYIKEMEELQRKNAAAAAAAPTPAPQPLPVAAPPPAPVEPRPIVVTQPAPAPEPAPAPFYKRAWFWAVVGGVVVAGTAAGLWAGGVFSPKANNECPAGVSCGGAGQ
jgi:hypothetical protein